MSEEIMFARALARQSLYFFVVRAFSTLNPGEAFIPAWHVDAICTALEDVYEGETTRLLITVPPRHLKSICTSVGFCAWALGKNPSLKIMTASYSGKLAEQHSHDFRRLVESDWYRRLFAAMRIDPKANRIAEIKTTRNGGRLAVSRGGSVTGFGADILIIDDLMKAEDARSQTERENAHAFFDGTLLSRLNDKGKGCVIVIQQRLHEDDVAGYVLAKGGYRHLNLPAIAETETTHALSFGDVHKRRIGDVLFPAREPRDVLERLRADMGAFAFSAQYQQDPIPPDGGHVDWTWFPVYDEPPPRERLLRVVQSWDLAITADPASDYSVCTTWGHLGGKWLLLDVLRRRMEFPALARAVRRLQSDWRADRVIIERAGPGIPLLQDLRADSRLRSIFHGYQPKVSKEERFFGHTVKLERGDIVMPKDAPWLPDFKRELTGFPNARHDDQVDSVSQFLEYLNSPKLRAMMDRDPVTGRRY